MNVEQIYAPVGCSECINGYKGRIALHEVLEIDQDIRDAIINNTRKDELRSLVYNSNVTTLLQDGLNKVIEGFTTMDEILRVIDVNDDFGSDDQDLKDAIIGKQNTIPNNNAQNNQNENNNTVTTTPQLPNNQIVNQNIETL